jgi:hypothetical protein
MIDTIEKTYDMINNTFCGYRITYQNSNRVKLVPLDEANTDYQAIQEWANIEGNNIIDPGA